MGRGCSGKRFIWSLGLVCVGFVPGKGFLPGVFVEPGVFPGFVGVVGAGEGC
jgi:hypothetical protein